MDNFIISQRVNLHLSPFSPREYGYLVHNLKEYGYLVHNLKEYGYLVQNLKKGTRKWTYIVLLPNLQLNTSPHSWKLEVVGSIPGWST